MDEVDGRSGAAEGQGGQPDDPPDEQAVDRAAAGPGEREFRRPDRDYLPVSASALAVYGLLTILLTIAIAMRVPARQVDEVVGLLQLARTVHSSQVVVATVAVIAFGTMTLNATAWVWGISRLLAGAAGTGILPRRLAATTSNGVPGGAVLLLGGLFAVVLGILALVPRILVDAVAATRAIFIVMYLLTIVSYARVRGLTVRSVLNLLLLVLMGASLVQAGWRSVYGVAVLVLALAAQFAQRRRLRPDA